MILRLALIGFGNVGQEFARLLIRKRDWLLKERGLDIEVLVIATKTRGSLISSRALDMEHVLDHLHGDGTLSDFGPESTTLAPLQIIDKTDADLMIELTPLNIDSGQPAIDHIKAAFEVGLDVVTANKGPIAYAYNDLRALARSKGVHFRFEGTVMDGTPVFNLVEKTLPGCQILAIEGILNSTSNFVLTEMSRGKSMEDAIKEAQAGGFAEAEPSLDIDGWDAAAKITALANVLMAAGSNPKKVDREGIRHVSDVDLKNAKSDGLKIKQIARATREGDDVRLQVKPELINSSSPFWSIDGTSSAVRLKTDLMGEIAVSEINPSVTQTAYAIFSDILLITESIRAGTL